MQVQVQVPVQVCLQQLVQVQVQVRVQVYLQQQVQVQVQLVHGIGQVGLASTD